MALSEVRNLTLIDSVFENLVSFSAVGGGALSIIESPISKSPSNVFLIKGTKFLQCMNYNGGAISLREASNVIISAGTEFIGNKAQGKGGAIDFSCSNYGEDTAKCNLTLDSVDFVSNSASIAGGAISWNVYEPLLKRSLLSKNKAGLFGDSLAAVSHRLIRIRKEQLASN